MKIERGCEPGEYDWGATLYDNALIYIYSSIVLTTYIINYNL